MMNKYQKALKTLKSKDIKLCVYKDVDYEDQPSLFDLYYSEIFALQELVDITNQTKPIYKNGRYYCPNCGSGEYLYNEDGNKNTYCSQCGQKIDWSEEDESY